MDERDPRRTANAGSSNDETDQQDHAPCVESQVYHIRVKGHLDSSWSEWLGGLTITEEEGGTTVLTGPIADQPALHGLLAKIRDLGLPLLSVKRTEIEG